MLVMATDTLEDASRWTEARWWVVEGVDKKKARLNCIHHPLWQVAYHDVEHSPIVLPEREHKPDCARQPAPKEMYVPAIY